MCNLLMIFLKLRELHEKEWKYINCSEFPQQMACAKSGSEGRITVSIRINNIRSSEIQGTALGKCLQAWPVYTGPCLRV